MYHEADALIDRIVPRRAAAKKASQLAAEQLESSPAPSDRESTGPAFGEPSKGRGGVKYKYGGKGKYKPLLPTSRKLSTERPKPQASSHKPSVSHASRSRGRKSLPPAKKQVAPLSQSSSSTEDSLTPLSDDVAPELELVGSTKPSWSAPAEDLPRSSANSSPIRRRSTTFDATRSALPVTPTLKRPTPSDRALTDDDGSTLTPVTPSPEPDIVYIANRSPTRLPSLADHVHNRAANSVAPSGVGTPVSRKHLPLESSIREGGADVISVDTEWDFDDIGSLVWVKIDIHGNLIERDTEEHSDALWWPAKVISSRKLLRVSLFGHSPASSLYSLMSIYAFMRAITEYRHESQVLTNLPRRKQKLDLDARWMDARNFMLKAYEDDNDGLTIMLSAYIGDTPKPNRKGLDRKGASHNSKATDDISIFDDDDADLGRASIKPWRAPSCNPLWDVPGELVLAREKRSFTQYWPAKLVQYIKPTHPKQKPRYKVLFYDNKVRILDPSMFYTSTDDEFASCNLGEDQYHYGLDEDRDVVHAGEANYDLAWGPEVDESLLRASSPLPDHLPPPGFEYDLSIAEQFEYIKPVLAAVVDRTFEPARERHDGFMRGGGARQKVCDIPPVRGNLRATEKEEVALLVRSWAQRRYRRTLLALNVDYTDVAIATAPTADNHPSRQISRLGLNCLECLDIEAPPSSLATMETVTENDQADPAIRLQVPEGLEELHLDIEYSNVRGSHEDEDVPMPESTSTTMNANPSSADTADDSPPLKTFMDLDEMERLTYCNNVLLHEAVLQLLLWRSGQRRALGLLRPEEEQRLHDLAVEKGDETYWVHDIIRLRDALQKTCYLHLTRGYQAKRPDKGDWRDTVSSKESALIDVSCVLSPPDLFIGKQFRESMPGTSPITRELEWIFMY
ncbi:hypothetical protein A0H81_14293 [Grifola frondosa]|uniref:Uncharacterized protein n=1 Tax=Grifola frondosa TaxID=5627 RepID=A0A1C7LLW4_GRIFR|nr:hypothetical protein A0H81_14293 [Grifola frondosa]